MKKNCELCKCTARVYCESDQASLCWSCDSKVHSANFLVARHVRALLCNSCQSPTPWNASGDKLGRTISLCQTCVRGCCRPRRNKAESGCDEDEDDSESGIDNDADEQVLKHIDNQVVPLSSSTSTCSDTAGRDRPQIDINISPEKSNSHDDVSHLNSEDDDLDTESKCARPFKFRKLEGNRRSENNSSRRADEEDGDRRLVSEGEMHESLDLDLNECPPN